MNNDELSAWVCDLIARRRPESDDLDYKATLAVATRAEKLELAKDVSSFANEGGGTVLYGIPEDASGEAPVPQELAACGMAIPPKLPETAENILLETVDPPLPECVVRVVSIANAPEKKVLLVYHPASWNRPHMTLYKDGRYYRRGNFRAVLMREREVEAAYAARRAAQVTAHEFLASADLGTIPEEGQLIRVTVVPHQVLLRREAMRETSFKQWLDREPVPEGVGGAWAPFLDGWRFLAAVSGPYHGRLFEVRLFHSSAVSWTFDLSRLFVSERAAALLPASVENFLRLYGLRVASKAFEFLGVGGPVTIRVVLYHVSGLEAAERDPWRADYTEGRSTLGQDILSFEEESSAAELQFNVEAVIARLTDRLMSAFGMWRK